MQHKFISMLVIISLLLGAPPMPTGRAQASELSAETLPSQITIPPDWQLSTVRYYPLMGKVYKVRFYTYFNQKLRTIPVATIVPGESNPTPESIITNSDELKAIVLYALWDKHDPYRMDLDWADIAPDWQALADENDPSKVDGAMSLIIAGKFLFGIGLSTLFPQGTPSTFAQVIQGISLIVQFGGSINEVAAVMTSYPTENELRAVIQAVVDLDPSQEQAMDARIGALGTLNYLKRFHNEASNSLDKFGIVLHVLEHRDALPTSSFAWTDPQGTVTIVSNPQALVRASTIIPNIILTRQINDLGINAKSAVVSNQLHATTNAALALSLEQDLKALQNAATPSEVIYLVTGIEKKADYFYKIAYEMNYVYHYYLSVINHSSWIQDWLVPDQDLANLQDITNGWKNHSRAVEDAIIHIHEDFEYFLTLNYPNFVNITPPQTYTLSGTIKDPSNNPIGDVMVTIGNQWALTNVSGQFSISGIPAGTYNVIPTKTGYTFTPAPKQVALPPSQTANFTGTLFQSNDTFTFFPTEDVYLRKAFPSEVNNGSCIRSGLEWYGGYQNVVGLLKFGDLTTNSAIQNKTLYSAVLKLYPSSVDANTRLSIWQVGSSVYGSWNESTTYATFPYESFNWYDNLGQAMKGSITLNINTSDQGNWLSVSSGGSGTIKSAVQAVIDRSDPNYGFLIDNYYSNVDADPCLGSSESSSPPRLELKILTGTPDLVVKNIITTPAPINGTTFEVGQTIDIAYTVFNNGPGGADVSRAATYLGATSSDLSYYLDDFSSGQLLAGQDNVDNLNYRFTPSDVGTRYIIVKADWESVVSETIENNNVLYIGPFDIVMPVPPNTAPTITNLPDISLDEDGTLNHAIDLWAFAADAQTQDSELVYALNNQPEWMAGISLENNRYININPALNWNGLVNVEIKVYDPEGLSSIDTFSLTVNPINDIPQIAPQIPNQIQAINQPITIDLTASEHDVEDSGISLDWTVSGLDNATITGQNSDDDVLTFIPPSNFTGNDVVTLALRDSQGAQVTQNLTLTWSNLTPEMDVRGNNVSIADGDTTPSLMDHTDFGSINIASGNLSRTYTIYNTGNTALNFTGTPKVTVGGANSIDFSVTTQPVSPVAATNGSTTFTVVCDPSAAGFRLATISIANNDSDENPYEFSIQCTGFVPTPEMDVKGKNVSIADGDTIPSLSDDTEFGSVNINSGTVSHTFTIYNTGNSNLLLNGTPKVAISGANAADFTVNPQPTSPVTGPSSSTSFTITFNPSLTGSRTATISIANNDPDENPYTFVIQGTGIGDSSCGALLFADDFSTDKGWINQSQPASVLSRDTTNQWLNWEANRQKPLHYYYPIDASSEEITLESRFYVAGGGDGAHLWVGLAEGLREVDPVNGGDIPGVFTAANHVSHMEFLSLYSDRTYTFFDTGINYGGTGKWRKAILHIRDLDWDLMIKDDTGNLIGQDSGTLQRDYLSYKYVMLMFDYGGETGQVTGRLDDIKVYGCPNTAFEDYFTDGNITSDPPWTPNNNAYAVLDGILNSDGLNTDQSDRYLNGFNSRVSMQVNDYLEFSYRGMLKSQGSPQTGRGTQLVLGTSQTDTSYSLNIQRGYTNGFPTNKYSLSLTYGASGTLTDLITTDFQPNYDQFYEVKAIRANGQWSLHVNGVLIGSAQDPGGFSLLEHIVLYTVGSVSVDNIRAGTVPLSNTPNVDVLVGGFTQGNYYVPIHGSMRQSFAGVNNGPVRVTGQSINSLIAAERVIYKVNNVNTSFSEMMGLPNSQLDTTYWLPWYNNRDLDTQLRFANVSDATATVHVYIGGVEMGTGFTLTAGASTRQSFANINNGPVKIESNVPIVAAERVIYKVNGINTSFSEMMALSNSQLSTTYWFPWYNNKDLDTQIRFANINDTPASIHIYVGGVEMGSGITLDTNESTRVSFANINNGPVKIVSDKNIVAAERVIYKVNNVNTSFSEMMGLPNSQLDTTYWLPWYNNRDLDTQLRFANTTEQIATVHVYIGGVEMGTGFTLQPNQSTRQSFTNVNNGPVRVVSNVPIVVAERVIYQVNNVNTSFSEMMALPNSQLSTSCWFPWYNNKDLDTQLRFGAP